MAKNITIIIADDSQLWRNTLVRELKGLDFEVIAVASDGSKLLEQLETHTPDLIILDLEMPEMDGNIAFNHIRSNYPELKIVILSQYDDLSLVENYKQRGASAFFSKSQVADQMNDFARDLIRIHENDIVLQHQTNGHDPVYTERERKIIPLICQGKTSKEIAEMIQLSEKSVERIRQSLFAKTDSKNVIEFVRKSIKNGFEYLGD